MKKIIILLTTFAVFSCDNHQPSGVLVGKEYVPSRVMIQRNPATKMMTPHVFPETFVFIVQCDSCHEIHRCNVEKGIYNAHNVGERVESKGCYVKYYNSNGEETTAKAEN